MALPKIVLGVLAILLALASGCAATKERNLVEARAENLSLAQKQLIESKISLWFGGVSVTLANNVFSESSQVSIERKARMDDRRLPIEGRHSHPAFTFTLLTDGTHCVLRNEQTGDIEKLGDITCQIASTK